MSLKGVRARDQSVMDNGVDPFFGHSTLCLLFESGQQKIRKIRVGIVKYLIFIAGRNSAESAFTGDKLSCKFKSQVIALSVQPNKERH